MAPPTPTIELTEEESKIRQLLVDVAHHIDKTSPRSEPTCLRITGGWVRDKLLKGKSHDIDIGINNMTGYEFASEHLQNFLAENLEKYNIPSGSVHKIESNPEKSKHLETATMKIMGLDIDFVNLRSETYSEESRIPQMEFGTPKQDALRRDACVNALFYNLMSETVEDFTERGLQDMEDKLIRTPLAPYETFKDDPLRVLRLIRFASRLGFTIVPEVEEAMMNPDIKDALKMKISRERVGTEMEKMLYGANPHQSLEIIERLKLADCIFDPPDEKREKYNVKDEYFKIAIDISKWLFEDLPDEYRGVKGLVSTDRDKYIIWIFSAVTPWKGLQFPKDKKKQTPAAASAARDGLKLSNKDFESIARCYHNLDAIRSAVPNISDMSRSDLGTLIRNWGSEWRIQVFAGLVMDLVEKNLRGVDRGSFGKSEETVKSLGRYEEFVKRVEELRLEDAWDFKPLLTGTEVQTTLNRKPGKWLKGVLDEVMIWQLDHPDGTKDEAKEFVKGIATD
ncbi:Phosphatase [Dactylella cylindrospora]|nr:Phosphatase [Dactylella cylindrospora]